jgi:hypothetical protein
VLVTGHNLVGGRFLAKQAAEHHERRHDIAKKPQSATKDDNRNSDFSIWNRERPCPAQDRFLAYLASGHPEERKRHLGMQLLMTVFSSKTSLRNYATLEKPVS